MHTAVLGHRVTAKPAASRVDDTALVRAAQKGDHAAFEELVRLYDQSVLRLALNMLRSEEEARDVYQEAFLKIYRSLGSFRDRKSTRLNSSHIQKSRMPSSA